MKLRGDNADLFTVLKVLLYAGQADPVLIELIKPYPVGLVIIRRDEFIFALAREDLKAVFEIFHSVRNSHVKNKIVADLILLQQRGQLVLQAAGFDV